MVDEIGTFVELVPSIGSEPVVLTAYQSNLRWDVAMSATTLVLPIIPTWRMAILADAASGPDFRTDTAELFWERLRQRDEGIRQLWLDWLQLCGCPINDLRSACDAHSSRFPAFERECPVHVNLYNDDQGVENYMTDKTSTESLLKWIEGVLRSGYPSLRHVT